MWIEIVANHLLDVFRGVPSDMLRFSEFESLVERQICLRVAMHPYPMACASPALYKTKEGYRRPRARADISARAEISHARYDFAIELKRRAQT